MIRMVFLIGRLLDYLIVHFDYWIMDHLISQISTHFLMDYYPKKKLCT
jgi:hypothetical protein